MKIPLKPVFEDYFRRGVEALQRQDYLAAMAAMTRAIELNSRDPGTYLILAAAARGMGDLSASVSHLNEALALSPSSPKAHFSKALSLYQMKLFDESIASAKSALRCQPTLAAAPNLMGLCWQSMGMWTEALRCFDQALSLESDYFEAYLNKALVLGRAGEIPLCEQALLEALKKFPKQSDLLIREACSVARDSSNLDYLKRLSEEVSRAELATPMTNFLLGSTFYVLGDLEAAKERLVDATKNGNCPAEAWSNLAIVHEALEDFDGASEAYRRALSLSPDEPVFIKNLGVFLMERGDFLNAKPYLERAVNLRPSAAESHFDLGVFRERTLDVEGAIEAYRDAVGLSPNYYRAWNNLIFVLTTQGSEFESDAIASAKRFGALCSVEPRLRFRRDIPSSIPTHFRIGLMSADFREHPVGYFIESILEELGSKVEVVCLQSGGRDDALTDRLKLLVREWVRLPSDDSVAENIIGELALDFCIDLSGHTAGNRLPLFARRLAPVQVSWLGFFGTTGVEQIDYILGDSFSTPLGDEQRFVEKLWRMPRSRWCFSAPEFDLTKRVSPITRNGFLTVGCFSNLRKVGRATLDCWAALLRRVPSMRLLVKSRTLDNEFLRGVFTEKLEAVGIDLSRVHLEGSSPREIYLSCYRDVDLILDTFPFSGGTTTMEALWMNTPVLTVRGSTLVERQTSAILTHLGLEDWVASGVEEYIEIAANISHDQRPLEEFQSSIGGLLSESPIMNAKLFADDFLLALQGMWCDKFGR